MTLPEDFLPRARQVLLPFVRTVGDRDDLLTEAFYTVADARLYYQIEREGSPRSFSVRCLRLLVDYGCLPNGMHAAAHLLKTVRFDCGTEQHPEIDDLIAAANGLCAPPGLRGPGTIPEAPPQPDPSIAVDLQAQIERYERQRRILVNQYERDELTEGELNAIVVGLDANLRELRARLPEPSPPAQPAATQTIHTPPRDLQAALFLSYSHYDVDVAQRLQADLQRAGHPVWIDQSRIKGGDEWVRTIAEGINSAYAVVVVTSRQALASRWTRNEVLWAYDKDKLVVPVLVEDVFDDPHFILLRGSQGVKVYERGYEAGLRELLASLPSPRLPQVADEAEEEAEAVLEMAPEPVAVAPTVPRRRLELAYLERLKLEELLNTDRYTPLAGESQVNGGAEMPTVFELIPMRQEQAERRQFENAVAEITHLRRAVLLGEPGGGKTTTIWKLARELVERAEADKTAPVPVLIRLGKWTDAGESLTAFIREEMGALGEHLEALLGEKRAALLLDGLNEIPVAQRRAKSREVQALIQQHPDLMAVVSCREQDYTLDLGFDKINITPLDPLRIREFATRYLGDEQGEALFWKLAGARAANYHRHILDDMVADGVDEATLERVFWLEERVPEVMQPLDWLGKEKRDPYRWRNWLSEREKPSSLMVLARNPYMLLMLTSVYAEEGDLPENRGELFRRFVETLLLREGVIEREATTRRPVMTPRADDLLAKLAAVAYEMQVKRAETTDEGSALTVLPVEDVRRMMGGDLLYLAGSASVLSVGDEVRFTHQLLQEYFAARYMDTAIRAGKLKASAIWPPERWWERTNWEEAAVLLAGLYSDDPTPVLKWVAEANPEVAAQCVVKSGAHTPDETLLAFREAWLPQLIDLERHPMPEARAAIGRALGQLTLRDGTPLDNRKGVSVVVRSGVKVPDIDWVLIASKPFIYQDEEHPALPAFEMSRYPVTYAQFQCFVDAPDFNDDRWWAGMPERYTKREHLAEQAFKFWNHPRERVSWYQAVAFTRWLSAKTGDTVTLPTEQQYERAARGTDGRIYPYGNEFDSTKGNTLESGLGQTSAVGIYPQGASPEGVLDVSGNVYTWCLNKYDETDMIAVDDSGAYRVLRGGGWYYSNSPARAAFRFNLTPYFRSGSSGLVLCRVRPPSL